MPSPPHPDTIRDQVRATLAELETPELTDLQARLVRHAVEQLGGAFVLKELHRAFKAEISLRRLADLAQAWEDRAWLSPAPRKVLAPLQRAIGYAGPRG